MHKRKQESILWVKSFKQNTDPEKYYHSHLILYLPWGNENELLGNCTSYQDYYQEVSNIVKHNAENFHLHNDQMDAAINYLVDNGPPQIVWDSIAPAVEENNTNTTEDDVLIIHNIDSEEDDDNSENNSTQQQKNSENNSTRNKMSKLFEREACKDIMSNVEYRKHLQNLNDGQWQIVMSNRLWCKTYVRKM